MEATKPLKASNNLRLGMFLFVNVAVFWVLLSGGDMSDLLAPIKSVDPGALVVSLGLPLLVVVLNGLLSSKQKAVLVFMRRSNPLPGCRAFSEYGPQDARVDMAVLEDRYGPLPTDPGQQNVLWYRLSQKHAAVPHVHGAHRNFLLTRDLAVMSLLALIGLGGGFALSSHGWMAKVLYAIGLLVVFLGSRWSAVNYGIGLVSNVLAAEASSEADNADK